MYLSKQYITKKNIDYHNKIAKEYDSYREVNHPKVKEIYKSIFKDIYRYFDKNNRRKLNVLDIGCGTGFLEQFLDFSRSQVHGIDVSEEMLKMAKGKYSRAKYELKDIYEFKSEEMYDLIIENSVLHHLKDYNALFKNATRFLKPGGVMFLGAEPNYFCYHYLSIFVRLIREVFPDRRNLKTNEVKEEFERFAEYQMYFSDGINPFCLKSDLIKNGFNKVNIKFSSREFFASLIDRINVNIIDYIPNILLDSTGIFSRMFYVVAFK